MRSLSIADLIVNTVVCFSAEKQGRSRFYILYRSNGINKSDIEGKIGKSYAFNSKRLNMCILNQRIELNDLRIEIVILHICVSTSWIYLYYVVLYVARMISDYWRWKCHELMRLKFQAWFSWNIFVSKVYGRRPNADVFFFSFSFYTFFQWYFD